MAEVGGCRVGLDYRPPVVPLGANAPLWTDELSAETLQQPPDEWWRLYNDSRLDRLLQEAFAANTELAGATANLSAARAVLSAARAGRYPDTRISVGGIDGRDATTDEILELGGHAPQTTWLLDDILGVSYEVDLFGRVRRSIEASTADAQASIAVRDSVKVLVAAETTRAYAQVCTFGEKIEVARRSLDIVSHEAEITESRHVAGENSQFDVLRAQGLVAKVRAQIPPLQGQRRAALFELAALLGRTPAKAPIEVESCGSPPHLNSPIPVGDGAALLKRRPDVREAERLLAAATARVGVAIADLYPRISLSGLYGGVATNFSALTSESGLTWGVGPSISWSFPNQALPRARIHQAEAGATRALASFDSAVLTALKEAEQSLANYGSALDRRQALGVAQEKAHSAFDMATEQFLAGSLSNLDLLTSEQFLVDADESVADADAALVEDQISVFKALGGGWRNGAVASEAAAVPDSSKE